MDYDLIVLGATFTAAGLLQTCGSCLVLERQPQAGYEFFSALRPGTGYHKPLQTAEARDLAEKFRAKGAFDRGRECLYDCASSFYSCLEGKNVLLNMEILSVEPADGGYEVTAHGVSGFRSWTAKRVIDTRVQRDTVVSKTLNMVVNSETGMPFEGMPGVETLVWGYDGDVLVKCPVPVNTGYAEARAAAAKIIDRLPWDYRLVRLSDIFDCRIPGDFPREKDGVIYLPSVSFENPLLAFDAGVLYGKGGML